jgi:hypothetical protein
MERLNSQDNLQVLSEHHPLVIEGMGAYDSRDPISIASTIYDNLQKRWNKKPPQKPLILVTQGDPYEERGISAITRCLSDRLGISRILVFLDPSIASYHFSNADRYKVTHEIPMSLLISKLNEEDDSVIPSISSLIDAFLQNKIEKRQGEGKQPLPEYYRDFAMLQEVTKVACKVICGALTVAHTSIDFNEYSVSSFFLVGIELGMIDHSDIVGFSSER